MKIAKVTALTALASLFPAIAYAAAVGLSTSWQDTTLTERECISRAELAMRDAGFSRNLEFVGQSVFGDRGDYSASVRCITSRGIVFFLAAGPDPNQATIYQELISSYF